MTGTHAKVVEVLEAGVPGLDLSITGVSTLGKPRPETLSFATTWSDEVAEVVRSNDKTTFLVPADAQDLPPNAIPVERPRLAYAHAARALFAADEAGGIHASAVIDPTAEIGDGATIGPFVVIGAGVTIGASCTISSHAVIESGAVLGDRVVIGTHTSIGHHGFGFEIDDTGSPVRLPHLGGVSIGDDVEVGSHCTIAQGTIEPTVIEDEVKIDDGVFVAHNCKIGRASYLIAGAEISGSVTIGERVWVSPEAVIINKVTIGDDALVGLGAVVVGNVDANTIVAGVPAKPRGLRYPEKA